MANISTGRPIFWKDEIQQHGPNFFKKKKETPFYPTYTSDKQDSDNLKNTQKPLWSATQQGWSERNLGKETTKYLGQGKLGRHYLKCVSQPTPPQPWKPPEKKKKNSSQGLPSSMKRLNGGGPRNWVSRPAALGRRCLSHVSSWCLRSASGDRNQVTVLPRHAELVTV